MPYAAKVQCKGCRRPVVSGYCSECRAAGKGKDVRGNASSRGYNYRWQRESKLFLQQHPIAVDWFGTHNGVVYAAEVVDHIKPHRGDQKLFWDQSNWQGMTKVDHDRKTALEDGGFGR